METGQNNETEFLDDDDSCSSEVAIAYPEQLVSESKGFVIALYTFVALVLLTCIALQIKYLKSSAFRQRSEEYRTKLFYLNIHYFYLAFFSSVPLFLPASQEFSQTVQKVLFASGMVVFFQLTLLQMGGEVNLRKKEGVKIVLGSPPLCCLAPFSCTKLPITTGRLALVRGLIRQMPMSQFTVLYILMSLKLSNILSSPLGTAITTFQTISWMGGMWGMGMLGNLVGKSLDHTEFSTRQKFVQTMALLIEFQHILVVKILGAANIYPCFSEHIPGGTFAALLESTLVLLWCLVFAIWEHRVYTRVSGLIEESVADSEQKQLESGSKL